MDDVRALLAVLPEAPLPSEAEVEHADALIIVFPQDESEYAAAAERVSSAIELGPPIYVVIPPLDSGLARKYLQSTLQPGVYGWRCRQRPASTSCATSRACWRNLRFGQIFVRD